MCTAEICIFHISTLYNIVLWPEEMFTDGCLNYFNAWYVYIEVGIYLYQGERQGRIN